MLFRNCRLLTPWEDRADGWVRIHGEEIAAVAHFQPPDTATAETTVDLDGLVLAPGFIDVHCHGAGGARAADGDIKKTVEVNEAVCRGCGVCMATCPKKGIFIRHFKPEYFEEMIRTVVEV